MNELVMLKEQSVINRNTYRAEQVKQQKASDRISDHIAVILAYESSSGKYYVQNSKGDAVFARAITNSSLGIGDQVSLATPKGGNPIIDSMPI